MGQDPFSKATAEFFSRHQVPVEKTPLQLFAERFHAVAQAVEQDFLACLVVRVDSRPREGRLFGDIGKGHGRQTAFLVQFKSSLANLLLAFFDLCGAAGALKFHEIPS